MRDRKTGLMAAFLAALSPTAINFSQIIRPYALFSLLVALVLVCFIRAYLDGEKSAWIPFTIALTLAFTTHLLAANFVVGMGLFTLIDLVRSRGGTWRPFAAGAASMLLAVLIGTFWIHQRQFLIVLEGRYPYSGFHFIESVLLFLGPVHRLVAWRETAWIQLIAAALGVLCLLGLFIAREERGRKLSFLITLIVTVYLVSLFTSLGLKGSWRGPGQFSWGRYLSGLLPVYLVGIASGWRVVTDNRRVLTQAGAAVMLGLLFIPGLRIYFGPEVGSVSRHIENASLEITRLKLSGVIIRMDETAPIEMRFINLFGYFRRDGNKTFVLGLDRKVRSVAPLKSNSSLMDFHTIGEPVADLPAGEYAIVTFYPRETVCSDLQNGVSIRTCGKTDLGSKSVSIFLLNGGH